MSLFGDCAVKRAKYKPTTSALREYGICGRAQPAAHPAESHFRSNSSTSIYIKEAPSTRMHGST